MISQTPQSTQINRMVKEGVKNEEQRMKKTEEEDIGKEKRKG